MDISKYTSLFQILKAYRDANNLNKSEMARRIDMDPSAYGKFEKEGSASAHNSVFLKLTQLLEVSEDELRVFLKNKSVNDLTNKRFGNLFVVKEVIAERRSRWLCKCDCGKETVVTGCNLVKGNTISCGCVRRDRMKKALFMEKGTNISFLQSKKLRSDNSSGHKGVSWNKARRVWIAQIMIKKKWVNLGGFKNIEDAIAARKKGEEIYFKPILDRHMSKTKKT